MTIEKELKASILECYEKEKNHMEKYMKITNDNNSFSNKYSHLIQFIITETEQLNLDIDSYSKDRVKIIKNYVLEHFLRFLQDKQIDSKLKSLDDAIIILEDICAEYVIKQIYLSSNLNDKIRNHTLGNKTYISNYLDLLCPNDTIRNNSVFIVREDDYEIIYPHSNRINIEIGKISCTDTIKILCIINYKLKTNSGLLKKITVET